MDDLIIYGVGALVYFIFQALASRKKGPRRPPGTTGSPSPPATRSRPSRGDEVTLDDALREIRQALGMETAPSPTPEPSPLPPAKATPRPVPQSRLEKVDNRYNDPELIDVAAPPTWGDEFKALEKHYSDAEFESITGDAEGFDDPHYEPPKPATPSLSRIARRRTEPRTPQAPAPADMLDTLRSPKAAREAFVLHEILGPPRALRRGTGSR